MKVVRLKNAADPIHGLTAEDKQILSDISKDVFRICKTIDEHFLKASVLSISFHSHPRVEQQYIDRFREAIREYKTVQDRSVHDATAVAAVIFEAFANTTHMQQLWIPVMDHLANGPSSQFNNYAVWTQWVIDLDKTTQSLPELLARMHTSSIPIYEHKEKWEDIRRKVAFLDRTIDYAYTNKWGGFPKRKFHLGKEANRLMPSDSATGSELMFDENTPYATSHWKWPDNQPVVC